MRAGGELEQQHPEPEDVGAEVDLLAANLLGRHVSRGAQHRPRRGELRGGRGAGLRIVETGQTEIHELDAGVLGAGVPGANHVLGLQVAVQDVALVRGGEGAGDRERGVEQVDRRQRPAGQLLPQRLARHVLAHDAEGAVELLEGVDGGDARMGQARRGPRLAAQAPPPAFVAGEPRRQGLDRDEPAEPRILGEMHDPHAALAELADDAVGTQLPALQLGLAGVAAPGRLLGRGRHRRRGAVLVVREQGLDLGSQRRVAGAGVAEEPRALLGAVLQRPVKELADALPAFRIHRPVRLPSARPPARAGATPGPASSPA